jgi:hypothetical protein
VRAVALLTSMPECRNSSNSAAELLLFLHSGMMVNKGIARVAAVEVGRSA